MPCFTHRFETTITRHAVGTCHSTVVHLPDPFAQHPHLRIEADVGGVPSRVRGSRRRGCGT
jgi:hypothetical protein